MANNWPGAQTRAAPRFFSATTLLAAHVSTAAATRPASSLPRVRKAPGISSTSSPSRSGRSRLVPTTISSIAARQSAAPKLVPGTIFPTPAAEPG
ncbi:MAG TPA: hypothetical protein VEA60_12655, partial [Allosphingosinicella sp.]|nr:hypothetical protein [Allosphingosinicella sp.]